MSTTGIVIPETNEKGLDASARATDLSITTNEEYVAADQFCISLKELEKEVDAAFDQGIADAYKTHRGLVAKKNAYAAPIAEARKIVKAKMVAWQEIAEQKRLADEAKMRKDAEKRAKKTGGEVPVIVVPTSTPEIGTLIQTRWDFRVVDANSIPREYMIPDLVKIRQVVTALKADTRIPGIETFTKKV